jgi:flagellar motility protein MotE (MotC chaperone)
MMKIRKFMIVATVLFSATAAQAQFGALLGGASGGGGGGDISADVSAFVAKSSALSSLATNALTAINSAFSTDAEVAKKKSELANINKITDPGEKDAKMRALYESESAELKRKQDSGELEKMAGQLSAEKQKQVGAALGNIGIGILQAVDLGKTAQSIMQKASMANALKIVPVKDAAPFLSKLVQDGSGLIPGLLKLAKGANISVPPVTATSTPTEITM